MDDPGDLRLGLDERQDRLMIRDIEFLEAEPIAVRETGEPGRFQCRILIVDQRANTDNSGAAIEQCLAYVVADETGGAGHQNASAGPLHLLPFLPSVVEPKGSDQDRWRL